MKKMTLCGLCVVLLAACSEGGYDADYGSGSPLPSNIVSRYDNSEYNSDGLVTEISLIDMYGSVYETFDISYPQSDRAVMECYMVNNDIRRRTSTLVFAFGEDHYAHQIIEIYEPDGDNSGEVMETTLYRLSYDSDGHLTYFCSGGGILDDVLRMRYTGDNLTYLAQDGLGSDDAYVELTYQNGKCSSYGMSPFLLGVKFGLLEMSSLDEWFDDGFEIALNIGFMGKPFAVNLPATLTSHDSGDEVTTYRFEYYDNTTENGDHYYGYHQEKS